MNFRFFYYSRCSSKSIDYIKYKDRRIMKVQFHIDNPNFVIWEGDRLPYVLLFIGLLIIGL